MKSLESLPASQIKISWKELDEWNRVLFSNLPELERILRENTLNNYHLTYFAQKIKLKRPNWWLDMDPNKIYGEFKTHRGVPTEIIIHPLLSEYPRDKTLFHELCHIHYDKFIIPSLDESLPKNLVDGYIFESVHENLIEWLARRHRADYVLLREGVHSFELEPQIYDLPSYMAFASSFLKFDLELNKSKCAFNVLMD